MQDIVATFIACSVVICAIDSVTLADHCDDIVKDLRQSGAEVSFRETAETGREAYVRFDLRTITDQDMQKISRVPRLISLGFNLCEIPPDSWLHLNGHPHLRELTVGFSGVCATHLPGLPRLESLTTNVEFLRKGGGGIREKFPRLRKIAIHGDLEEASPSNVELICSCNLMLTELELIQAKITMSDFNRLGGLRQLRELSLDYCDFPPQGLATLCSLRLLQSLKLSGANQLSAAEVSDEDVLPLAKLPFLKSLCLVSDRINGKYLDGFGKLESLAIVSSNNNDSTIRSICKIPGIRSVELFGGQFTTTGVAELAGCRLRSLEITRATVRVENGRMAISNRQLRTLVLAVKWEGAAPQLADDSLQELPELQTLHVGAMTLANAQLRGLANTRVESLNCSVKKLDCEEVECLRALPYLRKLQINVPALSASSSHVAELRLAIPEVDVCVSE